MPDIEEPKTQEEKRLVAIPESLAKRAEQIKAHRGGSIGSIIAKHAAAGVDTEFREVLSEAQAELGGEG